ncbi:MAG TPA: hypothetical protein VGH44_04310 [Candidatus Saccharimonadia bacterium]|jgi:hypothetical protein
MKPTGLAMISTAVKRNLRYKPALSVRPRYYDLSIEEPSQPTAGDTMANALRLYVVLRKLWRKGLPQENGVLYAKVKGEFVEVKLTRSKF